MTFCHIGPDTMSRNQFNQKLKLIVEAPGYVIYSNKLFVHYILVVAITLHYVWIIILEREKRKRRGRGKGKGKKERNRRKVTLVC